MDSKEKEREGGPFLTDVKELRRRARQHIENGAVTEGYGADPEKVVAVLNETLATEIVCVLRYKRHYFMAQGIHAQAVAQEFLEHANEEQGHADRIAERVAIESYGEIVRFLGDRDITTRRLMEEILENEEQHADDLNKLLATLDPTQSGR